jgi:hypothetical protein
MTELDAMAAPFAYAGLSDSGSPRAAHDLTPAW